MMTPNATTSSDILVFDAIFIINIALLFPISWIEIRGTCLCLKHSGLKEENVFFAQQIGIDKFILE